MNKYQEVMEHLSVSELSRQRMLKKVREEVRRRRRAKLVRLLPLAAAVLLVVLLPLGTVLTWPLNGAQPEMVTAAGDLGERAEETAPEAAAAEGAEDREESVAYAVEAADLSELAERTGLTLRELTDLPFAPESVTYTAYADGVAEIVYAGEGQRLCWRISAGSEDNSGDYTDYPVEQVRTAAGKHITLRGEGEKVTVAWWSDGAQAYSIAADPALGREEMRSLAERSLA